MVFLSDYDMLLTEQLVQGVDVWINTPRRPWEASGTSGMKVLVNGGVNLSELDGWWAEAYSPEVGWALGDGQEHDDDPAWDAAEAEALYDLLEREVIPEFYARDDNGIPTAWVARMRESMARLAPKFSANRTVRQYTEQLLSPGGKGLPPPRRRQRRLGQTDRRLAARLGRQVGRAALRQGEDHDQRRAARLRGRGLSRRPQSRCGAVELYADGSTATAPCDKKWRSAAGRQHRRPLYRATVPAPRPATDYTARVIPHWPGVAVPLEESRILWQR